MAIYKIGNKLCRNNSGKLFAKFEIPRDKLIIDGREYETVQIGNRLWMAENLDYKYTGLTVNPENYYTTLAAFYWDRDDGSSYGIDSDNKCGLLYTGNAALYLDDVSNNLLPTGWRLPNSSDIADLEQALGGWNGTANKLKQSNIARALSWNGTNELKLNVYPTGFFDAADSGGFMYLNSLTNFWTSVYKTDGGYKSITLIHFDTTNNLVVGGSGGRMVDLEYNPIRLVKDLTV